MGYLPEERGLYPKVKISEQIVYLAELRGMKPKTGRSQLEGCGWNDLRFRNITTEG